MKTPTPTRKKSSNGSGRSLPGLVDEFFNDSLLAPLPFNLGSSLLSSMENQIPSANIEEKKDRYVVELSAPGLKRDDFNVELEDGVLTISSEKEEESSEKEKNYRRREFSYRQFTRSFSLPDNVLKDKINAKYNDGILQVTIPKREMTVSKPKKEIKVS